KARPERVGSGGTVGTGVGSYEPFEKSMMDIDACDYRFGTSKEGEAYLVSGMKVKELSRGNILVLESGL
nr:hypothetical protein [Tanacetum cinerariifolium]